MRFSVVAATLLSTVLAAPLSAQLLDPQRHDNAQPSLALTHFVDANGFVRTAATNYVPVRYGAAQGGTVPIASAPQYFSRVGFTWGGNGTTTVGLPDVVGRTIVGATPAMPLGSTHGTADVTLGTANFPASQGGSAAAFDNRQPGVAMRYAIRTEGIFPNRDRSSSSGTAIIGAVLPYAGVAALPDGWAFAEGQLLSISSNSALFALIGTTYGGDGITTFALPDLRGRTPIGTGNGISLGQVSGANFTTLVDANLPASLGGAGAPVANQQATLGLSFMLAQAGIFPAQGNNCPCDVDAFGEPFLSEVNMFAWQPLVGSLTGQLLRINQNQALFALLGTTFGGDGITTFALPDLQGRVVVGAGTSMSDPTRARLVGEQFGTDSFLLSAAPTQVVPEPATAALLGGGLAVVAAGATVRRRRAEG